MFVFILLKYKNFLLPKQEILFCFQNSLYLQSFRNKIAMNFLTFRERMYPMGCFNVNQILLWEEDFDRNNLTRWCRKGLLVKLRNEYYAFPEFRQVPDAARFVANRIYSPSYISLHSALSFYGMIPEEVVQITSITTLKTAKFENSFGTFHYQNVKTALYFGYERKILSNGRSLLFALPEKALLDLLYLNPFYRTEEDMENLRLDEDYMQNELDKQRLNAFLEKMGSKALNQRIAKLKRVYDI